MKTTSLLSNYYNVLTIILLSTIIFISYTSNAQNVAITDDAGYTADPSAMLDVKSTTKGMLVPRVTSAQRALIVNPAQGLLLFDTDEGSFYFYDSSSWINLSYGNPSGLFGQNGNYVYLNDTNYHFGVGTHIPNGKLEVKGDVAVSSNKPLFEVINSNGDTVFAVYSQGVRINVADDTINKAASSKSGFAVGGFSLTKGASNEYMRVTPDSVRIYIDDEYNPAKAVGSKGGFAVGGFSLTKGGPTDNYLFVQDDSTRVYVNGDEGFAVDNIEASATEGRYMDLSPENYFIGHHAGDGMTTGKHNSFFGYETGIVSTTASRNVFIGYQAGMDNSTGYENNVIGYHAGYNNTGGYRNNFMGYQAGALNTTGNYNTFIGSDAGLANTTGHYNTYMGHYSGTQIDGANYNVFLGAYSGVTAQGGNNNVLIGFNSGRINAASNNTLIGTDAGYMNSSGEKNVFLGYYTGRANTTGSSNVFIGNSAGSSNTTNSNIICIGANAGLSNTSGFNIFIGTSAGQANTSGGSNIFLGHQAGINNTTGHDNTYMGWLSGTNNNGMNNTFIGPWSGWNVVGGDNNVFIGYFTGSGSNGDGNVFIGNNTSTTGSNKLAINNSSGTNLIYGEFDNDILRFNANVGISTAPTYKLHVVDNQTTNDNPAIYGEHSVTNYYGIGVKGVGKYRGVEGVVVSTSGNVSGVIGSATGTGTGARYGIYGSASGGTTAWAGYFSGNVNVTGTLSKGGGSFKIDHPQDPENKYLYHSFVESPDMKNIYDGIAIFDTDGRAVIELPSYFEALNSDFRYVFSPIGTPMPNLYVEQEVSDNQFVIAGGVSGMKVSWQVTGIRIDPFAQQNRIPVEVDKPADEQGYYLHPEAFGQPESKSLDKHKMENK